MAEQVQAILDGMVAPLRDLEERGVFSSEEIRAIVERRRSSEYALRRRQPRKADFIEYIQHEVNLEKLRDLRVKRMKLQQPRTENREKFIGDKHISSHIHLIWTRTLRKFRSDLSLYLLYADYLTETKNYNKLSVLFAQALQIFPRTEGLWIRAASHEFFEAGNIQSARVLLQRGLRINSSAEDLWVQTFVLELHVTQKLQARELILRGDVASVDESGKDINENHPLLLAKIVYDNAIKKISKKVSFRVRFLDQCGLFPDTESLSRYIMLNIIQDCGEEPEAWIAMAEQERGLKKHGSQEPRRKKIRKESTETFASADPVMKVLHNAVTSLPTTAMYCQVIRFMKGYALSNKGGPREESIILADELLKRASSTGSLTADLVMTYIDFVGDDAKRSSDAMDHYISSSEAIPASVWLELVRSASSIEKAIQTLEQATGNVSIDQPDHLVLLLQLLGAKIKEHKVPLEELLELQGRIVYLAPGLAKVDDIIDPPFGVCNVMDGLRNCLEHIWRSFGLRAARKSYSKVLLNSGVARLSLEHASEDVRNYLDCALNIERNNQDLVDRRKRLSVLYACAAELFHGNDDAKRYSRLAAEERHERNFNLTCADSFLAGQPVVPSFDTTSLDFSPQSLVRTYDIFQVVHIRNVGHNQAKNTLSWRDLSSIFGNLSSDDRKTWCIESKDQSIHNVVPTAFLGRRKRPSRAYCSFLIQNDERTLGRVIPRLPISELGYFRNCKYEKALWVFFGRNPEDNGIDLQGRAEHTDAVSHDGTWHYQLAGRKTWTLRASSGMRRHLNQYFAKDWNEEQRLTITIEQGDILVVNTRLWFHQTIIPPQATPSVSYARDFCLDTSNETRHMTNMDGLYATEDIDEGTILFRETDMPSCELHRAIRADTSNCAVVELDDGTSAVVSTRRIAAGEFFCVPESDNEASDESVHEGEEDEFDGQDGDDDDSSMNGDEC